MASQTARLVGATAYGFGVFVGTAALGFALIPALAYAAGLFATAIQAQATFSFITLKAVPYLAGFSVGAAFSYEWLTGLSVARRIATYLATVLLVWTLAATIAAMILG